MTKFAAVLFVSLFVVIAEAYDWHDEGNLYWANDCDFPGNDLSNVPGQGENCGADCANTNGCTHFSWTTYNGGTCWLKQGGCSLDQATYLQGATCGMMKNTPPPASSGTTTRYWDCCKPSCSWNGKGPVTSPVTSCQQDGYNSIDVNAASGCNTPPGPAFVCNNNQPWAINSNLAYGYAAVQFSGQSEQDWCCACYQLTFTSGPVTGKQMVVQVTNTGADEGPVNFDLLMPGGGVGIYNGCTPQWNAPPNGWGSQYGGVSSRGDCSQLPSQLQAGCNWRFDWFMNANNPTMTYTRVNCPAELTQKSNCKRTDE